MKKHLLTLLIIISLLLTSCNADKLVPDNSTTTGNDVNITTEKVTDAQGESSTKDTSDAETTLPSVTESEETTLDEEPTSGENTTTEEPTTEEATTKREEYTDTDTVHVDADNNGYCDDCNVYVLVTVDFYSFNDLHGKFEDTDSQPGVDELGTYFENRS